MLEFPEMFGSVPLNPYNEWIKLCKLVPWREYDLKYVDNFTSKKGQRAIDSRMALEALLIKPAYKVMSDAVWSKKEFLALNIPNINVNLENNSITTNFGVNSNDSSLTTNDRRQHQRLPT